MSDSARDSLDRHALHKGGRDRAHAVAKAALSTIPVLGGAAAVLLDEVLSPPLVRRRDEFIEDLASWLFEHEAAIRDMRPLLENDRFVSVATQAIVAATKTHEREKRDSLRNAVLNAAVGQPPTEAKAMMFTAWLDQFTEWHVRVLKLMAEPERGLTRKGPAIMATRTNVVIERVYPELPRELAVQIVRDLHSRSLIGFDSLSASLPVDGGTSPLGKEFLAFITEPRVA